MGVLKKREVASRSSAGVRASDGWMMERYPGLWEFLTAEVWPEGGGARQPGSLTIFAEDGLLKICLSDREQGLVAFFAAGGLLEALEGAEEGLQADALDWRVSARGKGQSSARPGQKGKKSS